jgi:hypothetical protein
MSKTTARSEQDASDIKWWEIPSLMRPAAPPGEKGIVQDHHHK